MKNRTLIEKTSVLLVLCFVLALALPACKSTSEHPSKQGPAKEHPEHPEHPK